MSETAVEYKTEAPPANGVKFAGQETFEPLFDRVLILPILDANERAGIIVPDQAKEKPMRGGVMAVGPGKHDEQGRLIPMSVKAGDTVLYGKYAGTEVKINDVDFLIMHQEDVLGILR